jgi:hypothetical protein
LSKLVDPASPEIQLALSEVAQGLRRAESLAARARNLERSDPATARDLYRESLTVAADFPEALAGLKRTPPEPPTALDGQVRGDRIQLSWTPPPPDGLGALTYVVVRKVGGTLLHPGDGTRIAEVSTSEFDDTHAPPGETVGYAVLSKRGGVESVTAISLGPFIFLADVKDVRVELRHPEVELAWTLPRGLSDVRVIRKQGGPPKNPRDGERIPTALDHARDRNLDPDEIYHYGIYAIYAMSDGRLCPSPGIVVSARAQSPVSALETPRLLLEAGRRVRIDWIEPPRGTVKIIRTASPLPLPAGSQLGAAEAGAWDGHWIEPTTPERAYDADPPAVGHCYYTPLTVWAGTYTVGHGAALSRIADPSDLRATRTGSRLGASFGDPRITLRWQWPAEAATCLVVARQGSPPLGPNDPQTIQSVVPRADYDRQDCWTVSLSSSRTLDHNPPGEPVPAVATDPLTSNGIQDVGPWHIRVYGVGELDGSALYSSGVEPSAGTILTGPNPEITVSYLLKRPWVPVFPWSVVFHTEPPGATVPPMVLVAHRRAVPLSVHDGEIAARFPAARDRSQFRVRTPLDLSQYGIRVFPDPNVEPDSLTPIRLRHPESGVTRI